MKKLYRSEENKVWAGVIGGIGEYLDIDPSILRIAWVVIVVFSGIIPGLIVYFISLLIVPKTPHHDRKEVENEAR